MDFGMIPYQGLDEQYFKLPRAKQTVLKGNKADSPKVYVGLTKWNDKNWIGSLYPKGTKDAEMLSLYSDQFNAIELNATHYKIYSPEQIGKWAANAKGKAFKFCPKITNSISHYSGLNNAEQLTTSFLEGVLAFEDNLGPIFLQLSEKFSPHQKDKLYNYLRSLPADLQFFVELRHPDWFADDSIRTQLFNTLTQLKIGAVITDTPGRRDLLHMELPIPTAFIRFVCNGDHALDKYRIETWKEQINYWVENGLETCYFFLHAHNEAVLIDFARYVQEQLGIKISAFAREQLKLF